MVFAALPRLQRSTAFRHDAEVRLVEPVADARHRVDLEPLADARLVADELPDAKAQRVRERWREGGEKDARLAVRPR